MIEQPQFSIRRATLADATAILACLSSAFQPYRTQYTPDAYADTVLDETTIQQRMTSMAVFAAVNADCEVIGTIACQALSPHEGHLRGMAVQPAYAGSGVAAALLDAAETELRRQQCARVTLDTTEPLQRAMRFYEKHGYAPSGRVSDFFGMPLFEYFKVILPR